MTFAVIAITFASCGNKTNANAETTDTTVDTTAVSNTTVNAAADSITSALSSQLGAKDATTLQTTIATIQAKYAELVKSGNLEEAKVYA